MIKKPAIKQIIFPGCFINFCLLTIETHNVSVFVFANLE